MTGGRRATGHMTGGRRATGHDWKEEATGHMTGGGGGGLLAMSGRGRGEICYFQGNFGLKRQ